MKQTIIVSLGGSLMVPDEIDVLFLKTFCSTIKKHLKEFNFVIIPGGGKTARNYMTAAKQLGGRACDQDWAGIRACRANAELLRIGLRKHAHPKIISVYEKIPRTPVVVLVGGRPGHSSDYDAVLAAKSLGVKKIFNLTNIDYVYDKNPKLKSAKPLKALSWKGFLKIISKKWVSGLSTPFDPVASRLAMTHGKQVFVLNGRRLENFSKALHGRPFTGTVIE